MEECLDSDMAVLETYILDAELADGVVHQDGEVLHHHPDISVGPAALIRPVLVALVLQGAAKGRYFSGFTQCIHLSADARLAVDQDLAGVAQLRKASVMDAPRRLQQLKAPLISNSSTRLT